MLATSSSSPFIQPVLHASQASQSVSESLEWPFLSDRRIGGLPRCSCEPSYRWKFGRSTPMTSRACRRSQRGQMCSRLPPGALQYGQVRFATRSSVGALPRSRLRLGRLRWDPSSWTAVPRRPCLAPMSRLPQRGGVPKAPRWQRPVGGGGSLGARGRCANVAVSAAARTGSKCDCQILRQRSIWQSHRTPRPLPLQLRTAISQRGLPLTRGSASSMAGPAQPRQPPVLTAPVSWPCP